MRERQLLRILRLRHHFFRRGLGRLPFLKLSSILDHLLLALEAVPAVLLVRLLKFIERHLRMPFVYKLEGLFICFLRFFVCRPFSPILREQRRGERNDGQKNCGRSHVGTPWRYLNCCWEPIIKGWVSAK